MQSATEELCVLGVDQGTVEYDAQQNLKDNIPCLKSTADDFNKAKDFLILYETCNKTVENAVESASADCSYWRRVALLLAAQMIKSRPGTLVQQLAAAQRVWLTQASQYVLGLEDSWTPFVTQLKDILNEGKHVIVNLLKPMQQFVCARQQAVVKFAGTLQLTANHFQRTIRVGFLNTSALHNLKHDLEELASAWSLSSELQNNTRQTLQLAIKRLSNVQTWFDKCQKSMAYLWTTFPMQHRLEELVSLLLKEANLFLEDVHEKNIENAMTDMIHTLPVLKAFATSSAEVEEGVIAKVYKQMERWIDTLHSFQNELGFDQHSERLETIANLHHQARQQLQQWEEIIADVLQQDLSDVANSISAVQTSLEHWLVDVLIWLCSASPATDPESNLTCISQKITLSMLEQMWQNLKRQLSDVTHEMVIRVAIMSNVIPKPCMPAPTVLICCKNLETACRSWLASSDEVIRVVREVAVFKKPDVEELAEMQKVLHHHPLDVDRIQVMLSTFGCNGHVYSEKLLPALDTVMENIGSDDKTHKKPIYKTSHTSGDCNDAALLRQLKEVQQLQENNSLMNRETAKKILDLEEELCITKERLHLAEIRLSATNAIKDSQCTSPALATESYVLAK